MALIKEMPGMRIISGFRGVVDYYYWMGKPVARAWPRSPGKSRNVNVRRQWPIFTNSTRLWNQLSPTIQQAYRDMAATTNMTARDIFTKSYISGAWQLYTAPDALEDTSVR